MVVSQSKHFIHMVTEIRWSEKCQWVINYFCNIKNQKKYNFDALINKIEAKNVSVIKLSDCQQPRHTECLESDCIILNKWGMILDDLRAYTQVLSPYQDETLVFNQQPRISDLFLLSA